MTTRPTRSTPASAGWVVAAMWLGGMAGGCDLIGSAEDAPPAARQAGSGPVFENGVVRVPPASRAFIEVAVIDAEEARTAVRAPGQIVFRDGAVAEVSAPIAGRIAEIHVRVGDQVETGDTLITLLSPDAAAARSELARARAQLRAARTEMERQLTLLDRGVGVDRDRLEAEVRVAESEAALASAELAVSYLGDESGATVHVRAPIDGTVLERRTTLGASVEPNGGDPLMKIGDPDALWLVVDVFVDDLPMIEKGAAAAIEIATIPRPLNGRVVSVGAVLRRELRRAPVYITIEEQDLGGVALRNGMYARARIDSGIMQGVMVPAASVVIKDGRRYLTYVETEEEGTTFEQREVVVGQVVDDHVQVLSGLQPGERIVVRGALLVDGTADLLQ